MVTALYGAFLSLIFLILSVHVIRGRIANRVVLLDGDNHDIQRRIRAHGNFIEYTPLFLILLILAEMQGLPLYFLHGLGGFFVFGRLSHALSLLRLEVYEDGVFVGGMRCRQLGMLCTFLCLGILSVALIIMYVNNTLIF